MPRRGVIVLVLALLVTGCVRRTLTVKSDPPGALVHLNGVEVGRTPMSRDFTWYGTYDVVLRKEGYETLKTRGKVIAPWWQWVPIDLVAEVLPLHDKRTLAYTMKPYAEASFDPQQMLSRAEHMKTQLRSSRYTRKPTTAPTTVPAAR
jgi:PEGA domain